VASIAQKHAEHMKGLRAYSRVLNDKTREAQVRVESPTNPGRILAFVLEDGSVYTLEFKLDPVECQALATWLLVVTAGHEYLKMNEPEAD
jgi:hypothetical protein